MLFIYDVNIIVENVHVDENEEVCDITITGKLTFCYFKQNQKVIITA